jgi:hypothetical protein
MAKLVREIETGGTWRRRILRFLAGFAAAFSATVLFFALFHHPPGGFEAFGYGAVFGLKALGLFGGVFVAGRVTAGVLTREPPEDAMMGAVGGLLLLCLIVLLLWWLTETFPFFG